MEKFFETLACKEEYKDPMATLTLVGRAEHWWRILKSTTEVPRSLWNWEWFLREFYDQYFGESVKIEKELEFMALA